MFSKFVVISFVFLISIGSNADSSATKIAIKSGKVTKLEVFDKFNVIGQCKHEQSHAYHANVSGIIESVVLAQGNKVKKGDLIIAIDKNLAESTYSSAKASLKSAESTYSRDKILFEKKHLSKESLEKSEVNFAKSKHEFEQASKLYSNMLIRAPFDGEIGVIRVKSGDKVKEGDYLFSIIAVGNKNVFFAIPEIFHDKIDKNTEILMLDRKGNKLNASVDSISNYISDHGTVDIKVTIHDPNDVIHGSYINAELIINKHFGLVIPELSVLKNDNGNFIYKIEENNILKQIYIKLGSRLGESIELISNEIKEGDLVVTEGLTKVYEGAHIVILD
jgi:RND family efflux transporter MFP subunit